jgi:long-chain acyl-CoA synthetase
VPERRPDEPFPRPWLAHYPPDIPPTLEIRDERLPDAIERAVHQWPERSALVFYGARWTYRALWGASGRFAAALKREGFAPGDRLALYLPNCPAYPIAFLGALRLGVAIVQVSPLYVAEDLEHLLEDAKPKGIVCLDLHARPIERLPAAIKPPIRIVARLREFYPWYQRPLVNWVARRRGLDPSWPADPEVRPFRRCLAADGPFDRPRTDPASEVAVLQYTGGTTGRPKAAMLSQRNLLANARQCQAWFPVVPPGHSITLAAIPFFHVYGMTVALTYPLISGSTVILQLRPDVPEMLKLIARHHPVELPGVPALYRGIAEHPDVARYDIRSIRICVSGSAPLPAEVAERFERITGGNLIEGYGLSEASPVTHANPVEHGARRAGSIGLPLPLTDQRIVDLETGTRTLAAGEEGELAVRGPQVMLGYYGRPEESALVLRDGWLYTGDVGRIDADGYAFIVDRKKDLINVGGLKVYPREVEEVLLRAPGVAEAAVVGVPDPTLGEVVRAFIVPRPGATPSEAELIEFVRARLAHFKAPRSVVFRDTLPKSGVQKVLRRALRDPAPPPPAPVRT